MTEEAGKKYSGEATGTEKKWISELRPLDHGVAETVVGRYGAVDLSSVKVDPMS